MTVSPREEALPAVWDPADVVHGQRWLYSAGFNVRSCSGNTSRLDVELRDIGCLANAGARVAVLSHQGSWSKGDVRSMEFAAEYLADRLGRPVVFCPENVSDAAVRRAEAMNPGDIVVFQNTRVHRGEEEGDRQLARRFARLGDRVVVGGFSKAHRDHASNTGLLDFLPGYASRGLISELHRLDALLQPSPGVRRIALLGGAKPEKVLWGLPLFVSAFDALIVGGIVLNHVLAAKGYDVGSSFLGSQPAATMRVTRAVLGGENGSRIVLPARLWVASTDRLKQDMLLELDQPIPRGAAVVDFDSGPDVRALFSSESSSRIQAVAAGTPGLVSAGNRGLQAWRDLLTLPHVDPFLIGGDTVADLGLKAAHSTGGGAALCYLAHGTCAVLDALRKNQASR